MVITGVGVVSPIGVGETAFWSALCAGRAASATVRGMGVGELSRRNACQVPEGSSCDRGNGSAGGATGVPGRAACLALDATRQAITDAGLSPDELAAVPAHRLSLLAGTTMGETEFIENQLGAKSEDWLSNRHVAEILAGQPGSISRNVANGLGLRGRAVDLYGACAAGNMALAEARRQLLDGRCDLAIAGGADGFSRLAFLGFMRLRVMSEGVCRPFDERRDGLLVGEGAGMFVLERESTAKARGARIRARLIGAANACEDYHPTRPHPQGDGLARAIQTALVEADLRPADVDYVCAHGTGTPQNDAIEVVVMNTNLHPGTPFSSIKALTGHTMGAAAALEAAACVLSLQNQMLIPTWNLEDVLKPCHLEGLKGGTRPARVRVAMNNSAGFGGYNSSVILAA